MLFTKVPAILIDSENVGSTWTSLLQKDEKFELYICVTENAKSLNFTLLKQLTDEHKYKVNIIECKPGKNSLDFYLSSYLGYLIGKNKHSSYIVVSQDSGYDSVIEYWNKEGYDVKRIKKDLIQVKALVKRPFDEILYQFDIFENGRASIFVRSLNREGINYNGEMTLNY